MVKIDGYTVILGFMKITEDAKFEVTAHRFADFEDFEECKDFLDKACEFLAPADTVRVQANVTFQQFNGTLDESGFDMIDCTARNLPNYLANL